MTRQQTTVLWLGLILIGLNIIVHIGDVKSVIFKTPAPAAPSTNTPSSPPLAPGLPGTTAPGSPTIVLGM